MMENVVEKEWKPRALELACVSSFDALFAVMLYRTHLQPWENVPLGRSFAIRLFLRCVFRLSWDRSHWLRLIRHRHWYRSLGAFRSGARHPPCSRPAQSPPLLAFRYRVRAALLPPQDARLESWVVMAEMVYPSWLPELQAQIMNPLGASQTDSLPAHW